MGHDHPYGNPENVLKFSAENKVVIENGPMKKMFLHQDVKNRKIVAFSIIGAYRKGKSFFLDYCLRFLYAHYPSINYPANPVSNAEGWIGEKDTPLQGFSWRSGAVRDTTGIIMWNDVFLHTVEATGEKLAIFVMDTQGLFDNETSPMDNSRIFALGTLISSIQVLNLSGVVQEDQLQYLQFATEFAKFAASDNQGTGGKPFQNLMFLIRDWANPDDHSFGVEGGQDYLKYFLKIKSDQKEELKSVRQFIYSSFEELSCSLLPHPGKAVAGGRKKGAKYDGNWGEMDEDFKDELVNLIEHLLKPARLVIKKINGKDLIGSDFYEYVEQYFKLFQSDQIPQAQSIYESTVEKQMQILVGLCVDSYKQTIYTHQSSITSAEHVPIIHNMSKSKALLMYKDTKKMGNSGHDAKFKEILEAEIEKNFKDWGSTSERNIEKLEKEKEATRLALEEKHRLELEQIEAEKEAEKKVIELQRLKDQQLLDEERFKHEMEIAKSRLEVEQARVATIAAEKKAAEAETARIKAEMARHPPPSGGRPPWYKRCSVM